VETELQRNIETDNISNNEEDQIPLDHPREIILPKIETSQFIGEIDTFNRGSR
jgi:hypothetical protein